MSDGSEARQTRYAVDDIVASRFKIVKVLGSSEGGDAYLVQETERKRRMVLKHLAIPYVGDEAYEALREEIKEASLIRHKNLVQVYGLGKEHTDLFLVMEFVEGETLFSHLRGRRQKGQVMGLKAAYNLVAHLCNALQVVHDAGAFHGALTPRNIYITQQGRVKIANLVYGKLVSRHLAAEQRGAFFDSPFVAPETHDETAQIGAAADIYSLGLLTAELLCDTSLEDSGLSVEQYIEGIVSGRSSTLQDLLFSAIVQMPSIRTASVKDFKSGLKDAVDAPSDTELSSIVMGASDLHRAAVADLEAASAALPEPKTQDLFDLPDLPPPPGADEAFAQAAEAMVADGDEEEEIWLVQREGLDYGPFTRTVVMEMLHRDEINENTSVLNMLTQRRADLIDIREFRAVVQAYIPEREARRAREARERVRKIEQVKTGAKFSAAGLIMGAIAIVALSVIAYLQLPDPVPIEFGAAISAFPHTFQAPKVEEIALNVDTSQALAIFDPAASEADREAALDAWAEEHRKRIEAKRKKRRRRRGRRPSTGRGGSSIPNDDIDASQSSISFAVGEDGQELEALDDWEVEEKLYSSSSFRKQSDCFLQHAGGRSKRIVVNFVIVQSGQVKNVRTNASGELDSCLRRIFRSMRFRAFGGTIKKVSYPIEFG